jgi:tRNA-splicing ligase RtcB
VSAAPIAAWTAGSLPSEVKKFLARVAVAPDVARIAVMPDVHLAGDACVGTAIATRTTLVPDLLGSDLGCGVAAMKLDDDAALARDPERARAMLSALGRDVPTHRGPARTLPDALAAPLSDPSLTRLAERDGRVELGTLGRGNHFLELQEDEAGALWLMVHSGSRAMGPAIQGHHLRGAPRAKGLGAIDAESDAGGRYRDDLAWAVRYASENRRRMADAAAAIAVDVLGASPDRATYVECHHDAVARETHGGEPLWVHRKGAVPAHEGAPVLIPGSMGTASAHAVGRGVPEALATSAHRAGRALTRGDARRRISTAALAESMTGVTWDTRAAAHLVEEAPDAYKDLRRVLRAQRDLVRIVRMLRPVLVHKGT